MGKYSERRKKETIKGRKKMKNKERKKQKRNEGKIKDFFLL